jgi:hypothetical protein
MNLLLRSYRYLLKESAGYDNMHLAIRFFDAAEGCI